MAKRKPSRASHAALELAAIVASSDDAIIGKDLKGIITSWNKGAEKMYGYKAREVIGKPVTIISPPELSDDVPHIMRRLNKGERIHHYETVRMTKDGQRKNISLTVSPVRNLKGKLVGASATGRDITQQRQTQEALRLSERLATVGRLVATIAHEINNPLETISNLLYLLRQDYSLEFIGLAEQELKRISVIVQQTLAFNRDSSSPGRFRLSGAMDSVLDLYQRKMDAAGIQLHKRYRGSGEVFGHIGQLRQVFANLVRNAIEAVDHDGSVTVRISPGIGRGRSPQRGFRVTVADNGTGMPQEVVARLFEPFFTTKVDRGTGLGLWVSHGIIQSHGGTIRVRSSVRPGRSGTCFSIFLPERSAHTGPPTKLKLARGSSRPQLKSKKKKPRLSAVA